MTRKSRIAILAFSLTATLACWLAGCSAPVPEVTDTAERGNALLKKVTFDACPQTQEADWDAMLSAFKKSCTRIAGSPSWKAVCSKAQHYVGSSREFFQSNFDLWRVTAVDTRGHEQETGLMTGYYEPELEGSLTCSKAFSVPLLSPPDDLITLDVSRFDTALAKTNFKGKVVSRRFVPYDTRGAIEARRDLARFALCWVQDPVDAFFLQVQGSGRIRLTNGEVLRLAYADNNGRPYRAVANWLTQNTSLKPSQMSMERIRAWARENPTRVRELLDYNERYIFFQERKDLAREEGPVGSLGVPVTPRVSVAVDSRIWPLGLPFIVKVQQAAPALSFVRPVIAQDTGSAIRGALRFDYFWGSGDTAGQAAGSQKSAVKAWALFPKGSNPSAF